MTLIHIHGNARLTGEQVANIRKRASHGEKQSDLAREYGMCESAIHRIITYKSYRPINIEAPKSRWP
jgi:hypothetical protein